MIVPSSKYNISDQVLSDYRVVSTLLIKSLNKIDFAQYVCVAKNTIGKSEETIKIYGKKFKQVEYNQNLDVGTNRIDCNYGLFTWSKVQNFLQNVRLQKFCKNLQKFCRFFYNNFLQNFCNFFSTFLQLFCNFFAKFL